MNDQFQITPSASSQQSRPRTISGARHRDEFEAQELAELRRELLRLRRKTADVQSAAKVLGVGNFGKRLKSVHGQFTRSSVNFLHYLALRKEDLRPLQLKLARYGLSSLGRSESFVLETIEQTLMRIEQSLIATGTLSSRQAFRREKSDGPLTWLESEELLHRHTRAIFGPRPGDRHVYIMVTVPEAAEVTEEWARDMIGAGTDLFRVNTAHESPTEWEASIRRIRAAARGLKKEVRILMDLAGPKIRVAAPKKLKVSPGDRLLVVGRSSRTDAKRTIVCTHPEILRAVRVGERVAFDDGKFEAVVRSAGKSGVEIEVTRVPHEGAKIRVEKGINFPDTFLDIPEVTAEDLANLPFVARNADLVAISFAQDPKAIRRVRKELKRLGRDELGIVLKIETQAGFRALPKLLFEAMHGYPVAVMIARGDLAVEAGFERIVEMQEEILWLCEAAHVPVIWATQVLESMAKTGAPSRAEVTDAAAATRAECVMLNKGPYIDKAVRLLDDILIKMEKHTYKKRQLLRPLNIATKN